jgi:hypothetical protein
LFIVFPINENKIYWKTKTNMKDVIKSNPKKLKHNEHINDNPTTFKVETIASNGKFIFFMFYTLAVLTEHVNCLSRNFN